MVISTETCPLHTCPNHNHHNHNRHNNNQQQPTTTNNNQQQPTTTTATTKRLGPCVEIPLLQLVSWTWSLTCPLCSTTDAGALVLVGPSAQAQGQG